MADYETDEEQIEALKRWWRENGNSLLISAAVALVLVFSWRQWGASQQARAEQGSDLYQQILAIGSANPAEEIPETDFSTAEFINGRLRQDYAKTIYARFSALFMAKLYVDAGDLESAEAELTWILDNPGLGFMRPADPALLQVARLRLARVVLSQGEPARALELLGGAEPGAFAGMYAEVEGDAHLAMGNEDAARGAYERASAAGAGNPILELKLRDFGVI